MRACPYFCLILLTSTCSPLDPSRNSPRAPGGANAERTHASKPRPDLRPASAAPSARRQSVVETLHGQQIPDPYRWLEDGKSAEVQRWVEQNDRHARAQLSALPGRAALRKRLIALSYLESVSIPRKRGQRYFFSRRHRDREKAIYYYRDASSNEERLLLDPNLLSKDGSLSVSGVTPSWDGKTVAYRLSKNASDEATLQLMDVASSKTIVAEVISGARYASPSWRRGGQGFYYTRLPVDPKIPVAELPGHSAVYFHRLGTDPKSDRLVHPATGNPSIFPHAEVSRDGRYLFLYIFHGWARTDLYVKDLRHDRRFRKLAFGLDAKFEAIAHRGRFYLHTNYRAPNYRLFRLDPRKLGREHWEEIVPEEQHAVLRGVALVGGQLALRYLRNASTELWLLRQDGKVRRRVPLPSLGSTSDLVGSPEDDEAFFSFSSFTQPTTIYRTSVRRNLPQRYFELKAPVDASGLLTEQRWYRSKDGTRVSLFIVRPKGMRRDGATPFLLYGYGGFDVSLTPHFDASRFAWLDAGGALAVANLRGGGEYGESWHQAGMLNHKQNVFDDFIAAATFLIGQRYTASKRLVIEGRSNGGLLVGAALTQAPELFRAVACGVPLLDMLRFHLHGAGKTWIGEYGVATDPRAFAALYAYSPYHRVRQGIAYPALLMQSADSDDRVDPMHARKFVAALRHATRSKAPILLRVERKAGHGGADLVKKRVDGLVDSYAFLFYQVGLQPPQSWLVKP